MDPNKIFVYFSYAMAGIFTVLGLYVLFLIPAEYNIPEKSRIMFGVVLLLYGLYRFVSLRIKQRHEDEERQM
ncbi:MAG: hypothetical protein Q8L88_02795 [Bacteroidota bacterium]|nr:hypothetical protein [Bacteroidota bacterium]